MHYIEEYMNVKIRCTLFQWIIVASNDSHSPRRIDGADVFHCIGIVTAEGGEDEGRNDSAVENHHDHVTQHAGHGHCGSGNENESTDECSLSGSSVKVKGLWSYCLRSEMFSNKSSAFTLLHNMISSR
jgi:hypothetical protein